MKTLVFDIETGPLPQAEIEAMIPPFNPMDVKLGNVKDPDKIAAKLREAEANHVGDFIKRAALDAMTGRVVAIGIVDFDGGEDIGIIGHDEERDTIAGFWSFARGDQGRMNQLVGFNITQFDLPFLIRRSWKLGVPVPPGLRRGRYWSDQVVDVRDAWQLGDRYAAGSLDAIAKHLGFPGKTGDGAAFAELWATDRPAAEAYLRNDVDLTARIAARLNVCG